MIVATDPQFTARMRKLALGIAAGVGCLAVLVIAGWVFDVELLKSMLPGLVTMKFNTAIALGLCAASLGLLVHVERGPSERSSRGRGPDRILGARLCAVGCLLIALATGFEYVSGVNLGIDELLIRDDPDPVDVVYPGRIAPASVVSLTLLASALLALRGSGRPGGRLAEYLALAAGLVALLPLIGFIYQASGFSGLGSRAKMAVHTSISLIALAIGILCARPEGRLVSIVAADSPGGVLARQLFPASILIPLVFGWARLMGERLGWFDSDMGVVLVATATFAVMAMLTWITARDLHGLHLARKSAETAVHAQADLLNGIIESIGEGVVACDEKGRFLMFSSSARRIAGLPGLDVPPEQWSARYGAFTPDGSTPFPTESLPLVRAMRGESVDEVELLIRNRGRPEGARVVVSGRPLRSAGGGDCLGGVVVMRDVTLLRRAEQDLRQARHELERTVLDSAQELAQASSELRRQFVLKQAAASEPNGPGGEEHVNLANAARALQSTAGTLRQVNLHLTRKVTELDEFSYVASHDLQEPLRKLVSFSALLRQDLGRELPERAAKDLEFISEAARRMQALVQDLLALSRAGRRELQVEPLSLAACADAAIQNLNPLIEEKQATLTRDDLPTLPVDRTLITQLYQNLIGNALKFVRGRPPVIHLSARREGHDWILGVHDNGIGINPEHFEQIFAPFRRLHGRAEFDGSGIGLAICRRAAARHGGRIWVESSPGQGSNFFVSLPLSTKVEPCETHAEEEASFC
jgi:signal transduction histidine kinase